MANPTSTPFVPTTDDLREFERQDAAFHFAMTDTEVIKHYGGLIAAVWNNTVWGAGSTYEEALQAALERIATSDETSKPTRWQLVLVPVPEDGPSNTRYSY